MLGTLLIVFREIIEAGLIIGIVLAAAKGVPRRNVWVSTGVVAGIVGACLIAVFAGQIAMLFQGTGQEWLNAGVLLLAVVMLTWHNVWMASHGRKMAGEFRALGAEVQAGTKSLAILAVVCGIAVLREGSEVVLFLYGITLSGGTSISAMLIGGGLGIVAGAAVSTLLYFGLMNIPVRYFFSVTSGLVTLLAAGLAAQIVLYIQQAGYAYTMMAPVWDSSWLLSENSLFGNLLHTLIGYSDQPNGLQVIVYLTTVTIILGLMRLARPRITPPPRVATEAR